MIRPATLADAAALAQLHRAAMRGAMPTLPELHTAEDDLRWMRNTVLATSTVTVLCREDKPVAFVSSVPGWINQLHVAPGHQRQGLGRVMLRHVQAKADRAVKLWTFQGNRAARAFYETHGFAAILFTDGQANEERTPDVLYAWRPHVGA